jgi:hypothetical protein
MSLFGPYLVACTLLVIGGALKALRPEPTTRALGLLVGSSEPRGLVWQVRLASVTEAALGIVAGLLPYWFMAATIAACYLVFALFVIYVRGRGGPLATCACFSSLDARPTRIHVVVDLALAGCAASVAFSDRQASLPAILAHQPLFGIPLLGACALCTWLLIMWLVGLVRLAEARAPIERRLGG